MRIFQVPSIYEIGPSRLKSIGAGNSGLSESVIIKSIIVFSFATKCYASVSAYIILIMNIMIRSYLCNT